MRVMWRYAFAVVLIPGLFLSLACGRMPCEELRACGPYDGSSGDGGPLRNCNPSETSDAVGDECGVFASASLGDDSIGDGTKSKPYKTLATALVQANGRPVYACNETFVEAVVLAVGTDLYGGLDCAQGWIYGGAAARTTIEAAASQIPITLSSGSATTTIENFSARSADAAVPGGSSVAVLAEDGATAALTRCDLFAGNGAAGIDGAPGDPNGMPAASGQPGHPGAMACSANTVAGGSQAILDCGGVSSIGAVGGAGNVASGGSGELGLPDLGAGQAGTGEPAMGAWGCGFGQGRGNGGNPGTPGNPGAAATGMGVLAASGYKGIAGGPGTAGTPGQGGGGGGGAKGGMTCAGTAKGGASGGSGGSGGCGGRPGSGGGPGGASIGLVSMHANVTLTDCTITAGKGGAGGKGGDAQLGGPGALGGAGGIAIVGLNPGCDGGKGGKGGDGGPGGGGLGGPSIAVAHAGDPPEQRGMVMLSTGMAGPGGLGGNNRFAMNDGAPGTTAQMQAF